MQIKVLDEGKAYITSIGSSVKILKSVPVFDLRLLWNVDGINRVEFSYGKYQWCKKYSKILLR